MDFQLGLHRKVTHISKVKSPKVKQAEKLVVHGKAVKLECKRPKLDFKFNV